METKSSISFVPPASKKAVQTGLDSQMKHRSKTTTDLEKELKIVDLLGNLIFLGAFGEVLGNAPYLKNALTNGIMCDADNNDLNDELWTIAYGSKTAPMPPADRAAEEKDLKEETKIDCAVPPTDPTLTRAHKCFCTDLKSSAFCGLLYVKDYALSKNVVQKTCPKLALQNLLDAGNKALGKLYDMEGFEKRNFANEFGGKDVGAVTDNESVEAAKIFCDALDPKVETAVKELYASDGMYWIGESLLYSIIFGEPEKPIAETCAEPEYANNEYGKCVCKLDTGFSFCIYKVFAEAFVKEGYLDCTKPEPEKKTFVKDKKPAALPVLAKAKPSSSATASSLLMVPLVAAAALFARH